MKRLHDLVGQELLEYGLGLAEQLEYKKTLSSLPGPPDICEFCSRTLPTEQVEGHYPGHQAADAQGRVFRHAPCAEPECAKQREAIQARYRRAAERGEEDKLRQRMEQAGIYGANMAGLVFEGFDTEWPQEERLRVPLRDMLDKMQAWAESPEGLVLLSGPYGIGKTRLAVAALRRFLSRSERSGFFLACLEAWRATKALWNAQKGTTTQYRGMPVTEAALNERTQCAGLLVIDDMDKVTLSRAWLEWLLSIVNYRADRRLPMIITLNTGLTQLLSYLTKTAEIADTGGALFSRLQGMTSGIAISCPVDQPDYREHTARMVS